MSSTTSFEDTAIEFPPEIPSKEIACALKCADLSDCEAYDFEGVSKCTLKTRIIQGVTGTGVKLFYKLKGKILPHD